jgi:hypothetical protein
MGAAERIGGYGAGLDGWIGWSGVALPILGIGGIATALGDD